MLALAALTAAAISTPKQIACGDSGSSGTWVNGDGPLNYFATVNNVTNTGNNTLTMTGTFTVKPQGFVCDQNGVSSSFVGNGKGDHKYHTIRIDGRSITQTVTDRETSYDWIFRSEPGMTCDYYVSMDWKIDC